MTHISSLILAALLALRPDSGLRVFNPQEQAVEAVLECGGVRRSLRVEPRQVADLADAGDCSVSSEWPLVSLETRGEGEQRALASEASCETETMLAPFFGCKGGMATAAVRVIDGASYAWTAEGASIVSGAGTSRVTLTLPQSGVATLSCVITTAECSRNARAVVAVRDPLVLGTFVVPESANAGEPVTIRWSWGAATPTSQLLSGDALSAPVTLPASARSHTFTPDKTGSKTVELRASYLPATPAATVRGRRRASSGSAVSATECAAVASVRTMLVTGCSSVEPFIMAPGSVDAGATFDARVELGEGETSQWSVDNGTIVEAPPGDGLATIRAGASGEVKVGVRILRNTCERSTDTVVVIIPAPAQCEVSPTATLVYETHDCNRAVVKATFTGTPPFRGTWSDGASFETSGPFIAHEFRTAGTYSMTAFRDAICVGLVSGSPEVATLRPRAELAVEGGNCLNGKLVATLTGTPPFDVLWSDHTWVRTSDHRLERQPDETGQWFIEAVQDARCKESVPTPPVQILPTPQATMSPGPVCQFYDGDPANLFMYFSSGPPPYSVTWSDGVVTSSASPYISRPVPKPTVPMQAYEIVRATAGGCVAEIDNRLTHVTFRQPPFLDYNYDALLCPADVGTMTLRQLPGEGATLEWAIEGAEILSGQGTRTVTFRPVAAGDFLAKVTARYPDGACETFDQSAIMFRTTGEVADFTVTPSTIKKGEKAVLTFTRNMNIDAWSVGTSPERQKDLSLEPLCQSAVCSFEFTDTVGEGTVQFELQYSGPCFVGGYKSAFTTLTITP